MRGLMQHAREKGGKWTLYVREFLMADRTKQAARVLLLALASLGVLWIGWQSALIAAGIRGGTVLQFLPQTLPLLFSGALYVDRFTGLFGVILSVMLVLILTEGSRGAFLKGLLATIFVGGILTASTPLTLVAWLIAVTLYFVRNVAQAQRLGLVFAMTAIALSILLLSGGAFLADMTIVSTVSAQLPAASVFLALVLLFGGALWSVRVFEGAYMLIPIFITLRLCLFFLGGVSLLLLSGVALIAAMAAVCAARNSSSSAFTRSSAYLLFMSVPLTMIAVEIQVIDAVQCFLFGGLAIACAGMWGGASVAWPVQGGNGVNMLSRFLRSALPGTLLGTGALLVFAGFVSLAQFVGFIETAYLVFLALLTLCSLLFLTRTLITQQIRIAPKNISGIAQALFLGAGGIFFAHILAYLGTTLGGEVPDAVIEIALQSVVLSFTPWMLLVGSAVIVALALFFKARQPEKWNRITQKVHIFFAWLDARCDCRTFSLALGGYAEKKRAGMNTFVGGLEERAAHMTLKERGMLILALFIVTLIVLL